MSLEKRFNISGRAGDCYLTLSRINQTAHRGNTIGWNSHPAGVLPNGVLIWRKVNAVNLVLCDVTVEPLNLRTHFLQGLQ